MTVIGNADKNTEAEIYRDFIKAGVTFDPGNSLSCIKRILYETFAPEITNCSGIMTIPELAGWYNKKFLSASSEIACPKDFFNMPIWDKGFVWPNMNKNWQVEFVRLMKNIRSSDTRLSCITILAAGIMASILDFIEEYVKDTDIEIIQLSEYGEMERKFVTEFLSEICWQEVRQNKKHSDIIVFDEFQFLSVKPGSALSGMLREGRKFSLSVYMSSQFLGDYSQEEVDTLMQAGNILFFKPVPKERKQIAKYIDGQNYKSWDRILDNLKVGEAVLKGHFMINSNKTEVTCPIKCIIQKSKK